MGRNSDRICHPSPPPLVPRAEPRMKQLCSGLFQKDAFFEGRPFIQKRPQNNTDETRDDRRKKRALERAEESGEERKEGDRRAEETMRSLSMTKRR